MNEQLSNSLIKPSKRFRSVNGQYRPYRDGTRYKLKEKLTLPNGRVITFVGSGQTRNQCIANTERLKLKKLAQYQSSNLGRETLVGYCQHWIENIKAPEGLKHNTLQGYRLALRKLIQPLVGDLLLAHVSREHIQSLYADLQKIGKSYYSIKEARAVLCGALDEAVESKIVTINSARGVKLPRKPKTKPVHFSATEVKKILETATKRGEIARWSIALFLGLRQGECLGLKWDHVELDGANPHLKIRTTLVRESGKGLICGDTKTGSSNRDIPLSPELVSTLKTHRKRQKEALLSKGIRLRESSFVFQTDKGKAIDPANDRKAWIKLLADADVPYKKLHAARHTTATLMHANNIPLLTISRILGHASISTTAEFYAHVEIDTKRDAIVALESAVS